MEPMPQVYLSYAREDEGRAVEIYERLSSEGFKPWMTKKDISPGQRWPSSILDAIRRSDLFFALLSPQSAKSGSFQREIDTAIEILKGKSESEIFLIPVRLEPCEMPEGLRTVMGVDLFEKDGWSKLIKTLSHAFTPHLNRPEPPKSLVQSCIEGACVLYVGSGLSAPAGLPTWAPLLNELLDRISSQNLIDKRFANSLRKTIQTGDVDLAADSIVGNLQKKGLSEKLHGYLKDIFVDPSPKVTEVHRSIREIPFSAVFTTNFDDLLERTYENLTDRVYTPQDVESLLEAFTKRKFFILKLYGTLDRPETVLFTPAQYEDGIAGNLPFAEFLENLFVSKTILFIGSSLDGILAYLEGFKFLGSTRQHYALVAVTGIAWETKADLLWRRFGIQVLPYPASKNHPEVLDFLKTLAKRVRSEEKSRGSVSLGLISDKRLKERGLKRVRLENIGPFNELELELNPRWNILLGDNGVGKSTILKAIALGICGRDAQAYVERLIKTGRTSGKIILETFEGKEYITKLLRTSVGAEVQTLPGQRFGTEGWLAIGFPPMRNIGWERPKGPQIDEGKGRPVPDDLIPLLTGDPDPRVDQLKQLILNLDYRIQKEKTGELSQTRYARLMEAFFRVIDRLTGDLKVEFKGVDINTRQVMVITDDGEVPIEAVSQGTASLIGWIGSFMQRLYEVYSEEESPMDQYALVLLDEIDAHMHPAWQQSLVPDLAELFPNVQFIATTQSPLIVGGMPVDQVSRFARDEEGKVTQLEIPPDVTMGRADQVLTGRLFGLESTLDKNTQKEIDKYQKLLGKHLRTPEEEEEFQRLQSVLDFRIPVPMETPSDRRAQELLQALLREQVGEQFPEARERILQKAAELFAELQPKQEQKR